MANAARQWRLVDSIANSAAAASSGVVGPCFAHLEYPIAFPTTFKRLPSPFGYMAMYNDRMTEVVFANEIACNTALRMAIKKTACNVLSQAV